MSTDTNADDGTEEEQDPEHVAVGPNAWGRGRFETDALSEMVPNIPKRRLKNEDTMHVTMFKVRGFDRVDGVRGTVYADDILDREVLEVEASDLQGLRSLIGEVEMKAESVLMDAEEVEDDEDE